jgi:hypothetical protein
VTPLIPPQSTQSIITSTSAPVTSASPGTDRTAIPVSSLYLNFTAKSPFWTSTSIGDIIFPLNPKDTDLGYGNLSMNGVIALGPFEITRTRTDDGWDYARVHAWTESYSRLQSLVAATASSSAPSLPASGPGHTASSLAGAAVGSFFGGLILAMIGAGGYLMYRKRKERRERRDTQIQNTFDPKLLPLPFPDVALSAVNGRKDPTRSADEATTLPDVPPKESRPSTQLHAQHPDSRHLSIDETSIRTTTSAAAKRASISDKRQSFPTTLLNNRPRRALSTGATGLISPVATAHQVSDEQGLQNVVKHLRMQISTLFEQIEMHVDNFYQASTAHGQALSRTEQDRLRYIESPHLEDSLVALLPAAEDTRVLIKHCLTEYITSRLDYTSRCEYDHPLLPRSLLATYRLIAASNKDGSPQDLARWRIETLGLLGLKNVEKALAGTVRDASERVTLAFRPWIVKRYSSEARSSHLASIFREAVELGLEIFGVHGCGIWVWDDSETSGQVVLCPGFSVRFDVGHDGGDERMIEVLRPMLATR